MVDSRRYFTPRTDATDLLYSTVADMQLHEPEIFSKVSVGVSHELMISFAQLLLPDRQRIPSVDYILGIQARRHQVRIWVC